MTTHSPLTLLLGQDTAPPTPESLSGGGPAGAPAPGTTTAPGGTRPPGSGGFFDGGILPLVLVFLVVMVLFSILGQRKERKKREAMISAIKKHDRVQTIGGVIGSVVEVKPSTVVLKVDESSNTRITFARSAIQQILDTASEPEESAGT